MSEGVNKEDCELFVNRHVTNVVKALTNVASDVHCLSKVNENLKSNMDELSRAKCENEKLKCENEKIMRTFERFRPLQEAFKQLHDVNTNFQCEDPYSDSLELCSPLNTEKRLEELKSVIMGIKNCGDPCGYKVCKDEPCGDNVCCKKSCCTDDLCCKKSCPKENKCCTSFSKACCEKPKPRCVPQCQRPCCAGSTRVMPHNCECIYCCKICSPYKTSSSHFSCNNSPSCRSAIGMAQNARKIEVISPGESNFIAETSIKFDNGGPSSCIYDATSVNTGKQNKPPLYKNIELVQNPNDPDIQMRNARVIQKQLSKVIKCAKKMQKVNSTTKY